MNSIDKHSLRDVECEIYGFWILIHSDLHEEKVSKYAVQILA